jgi:ParB family transcriptional regulator, chromosome partitioning protein
MQTKLPVADFVAFRVPAKHLDPRRARLSLRCGGLANGKELNMKIQMLPLSQLVQSADNLRKTSAHEGIESLAANILAIGLLQNLQVRQTGNGKSEVLAGARRHAALKLLVKQKAFDKDSEIACNVVNNNNSKEISLAENELRMAMHPADQFEAFKALTDEGKGAEDIAARFGVTPTLVRQRLKLASVSAKLMQVYRDGQMSLDQLMAFVSGRIFKSHGLEAVLASR